MNSLNLDGIFKTIFTPVKTKLLNIDLNLMKHEFHNEYNEDDLKKLLSLSLLVTNRNQNFIPLQLKGFGSSLIDVPLYYDKCPIGDMKIKNRIPLAHVIYNKLHNQVIIVFTGTVDLCMTGIDLVFHQQELTGILNYYPGMKAHKGFHNAYLSIRHQLIELLLPLIDKGVQIIITGHSLGGALSTICALDLAYYKPTHYSFAAPLSLNLKSAEIFNLLNIKSYRVANLSDLIPMFPLPIMSANDYFAHVGIPYLFQLNYGNYKLNHSLAYLQYFDIPFSY